jgi:hypothetical protein
MSRPSSAVLAVTLAPEQEPYVGSVSEALEEARELPEGKPWYRAVFDGELAIGFVMLSWNVPPNPPEIIRAMVPVETDRRLSLPGSRVRSRHH